MAYKIEHASNGEKRVKLECRQEFRRVDPNGLPNIKQRIHRTQECDQTPLPCSPTEGSHRRILVVDDEKVIQAVLSEMLSIQGYEVVVASSGTEGLNLFLGSHFDLVLTDYQMPGMDGWSLAFRIKDRSPNTPVVMITGQRQEGVMEKIKGSCVDFVMFKPFKLDDILQMIQRMLETRLSKRSRPKWQ